MHLGWAFEPADDDDLFGGLRTTLEELDDVFEDWDNPLA